MTLMATYDGNVPPQAWKDDVDPKDFFSFVYKQNQENRHAFFNPTHHEELTGASLFSTPHTTLRPNSVRLPVTSLAPRAIPPSLISDFKKSTKRDKSNSIDFKVERMWDTYQRHLIIQVQADGISSQLNASYTPSTPEEIELDRLHSLYFFSVLNHVFLTDKGKTIIRKHMPTFNARAAYAEMVHHMTASTKAHH